MRIGIKVPLVVRLAGTNETEGRRIIGDSGLADHQRRNAGRGGAESRGGGPFRGIARR